MIEAPFPENEADRLKALLDYDILDTPPEPQFDDLTSLAARICRTPIALISLIDSDRQWFKSAVGLTVTETRRKIGLCAHAILQQEVFEIRDTLHDKRFANNPLVTGEPRIRFYAGAPLRSPTGHMLGSLCVVDHTPRELTPDQRETLRALGRQVITLMELRRHIRQREQLSQDLHDNVLQSLYAVGMHLEAGKLVTGKSPRKSKAHMTQAIDQLNHLVLDIRQFITLLKQRTAAKPDFGQALRQLVASFSAAGQATPELEIKDSVLSVITPTQGEQLLNIAREALSNSMRHAQATHRSVRLSHTGNTIRLVIRDNGNGFASRHRHHRGHGLANMDARAKKILARLTLDSASGKGTCVTVDVPREKRDAHA